MLVQLYTEQQSEDFSLAPLLHVYVTLNVVGNKKKNFKNNNNNFNTYFVNYKILCVYLLVTTTK